MNKKNIQTNTQVQNVKKICNPCQSFYTKAKSRGVGLNSCLINFWSTSDMQDFWTLPNPSVIDVIYERPLWKIKRTYRQLFLLSPNVIPVFMNSKTISYFSARYVMLSDYFTISFYFYPYKQHTTCVCKMSPCLKNYVLKRDFIIEICSRRAYV